MPTCFNLRSLIVIVVVSLSVSACVPPPSPHEFLPAPPAAEIVQAAQRIAAITMQRKGATYNLYDGDMAGQALYAVGLFPDREEEVEEFPGAGVIHSFIQKNLELLRSKSFHVGTWYNESLGRTYIQVSVTTSDLGEAKRLARRYDQTTVYDLVGMKEVPAE